jgi:hypothetical protein
MSSTTVPAIELDPLHRYWVDGVEFDGCTTTLASVGLIDRSRYSDEARDRGTYVHDVVHADLLGDLAEENVEPSRFGYLLAARAYIREAGLDVLVVERALADGTRRIAGKPDVVGRARGRFVITDWKTGGQEGWHAFQLSWYEHLARVNGLVSGLVDRVAVYLKDDGTYQTHRFTDRNDWLIAQAAITVVQARRFS